MKWLILTSRSNGWRTARRSNPQPSTCLKAQTHARCLFCHFIIILRFLVSFYNMLRPMQNIFLIIVLGCIKLRWTWREMYHKYQAKIICATKSESEMMHPSTRFIFSQSEGASQRLRQVALPRRLMCGVNQCKCTPAPLVSKFECEKNLGCRWKLKYIYWMC